MLDSARMQAAAERVLPYVRRTPLAPYDDATWLKLECMQPTGSFKVRGFFSEALLLPPERLARGLITVSAGNAAQACAYVAHRLGVPCRTLMFETAPRAKIDGVRSWGATPVLLPREQILDWLATRGWEAEPETFIHPFAGDDLMAAYGALGLEIAAELPDVERVIVPVGGGGLISGIAAGLKSVRPGVEVVGVQSGGYPMWPRVMEAGGPVTMIPDTIADGTTGPYTEKMHDLLKRLVDRWIVVPEERLRACLAELALRAKVVAEGAGALPFAALEQLPPGKRTVAVISGGNVSPALLAELIIAAHA